MADPKADSRVLSAYFLLTYAAILVNAFSFLREVRISGALTTVFVAATYLTYSAVYLVPAIAMTLGVRALMKFGRTRPPFFRLAGAGPATVYLTAFVSCGLVQVLIFADKFIFQLYGFHLNGFVLNLVTTRGGIDSLGGSSSTKLTFALFVAGLFAVQGLLLAIALYWTKLRQAAAAPLTGRNAAVTACVFVVLFAFGQIAFGVSTIRGYAPVLIASDAFPLYMPITFTNLARKVGLNVVEGEFVATEGDAGHLRYPLRPIEQSPSGRLYNLVFLVAESLRWDMLDPEIMPATWDLAQKSTWCRHHYSGGNGTRMAMFSMFYGLYGPYWFSFVREGRGPVLMDLLIENKYQMELYTSAGFSYPEFDRTLFVDVPRAKLHERVAVPIWRRDEGQVDDILTMIDRRDPARPFMTFMFFESPHANYHFPPSAVIRKPYMEDLNYATMDVDSDIELMKNRYINACHFLDSQLARIINHLREKGLLDTTIVLIAGDHGEEFMENGRWGHNSAFSEQQTRTPFVLWVPGRPPTQIDRITSHLDVPATLLPILGVTNPASDYSLGVDLYDPKGRDFAVLASWGSLAYVDDTMKAVIPMKASGFWHQIVTTKDDREVEDASSFYETRKQRLTDLMHDLNRFKQ